MSKRSKRSVFMIIISAMLWGTYGSFVTKISSLGMETNVLAFLRFFATVATVGIVMICQNSKEKGSKSHEHPKQARALKGLFDVRKEDAYLFLLNGIVSIVFFTSCYTAAIRITKIATAAALLYTAPVIVMLLSAFLFKEKMHGRKVLCVFISVIGCAFASGWNPSSFIQSTGGTAGSAGDSSISMAGILLGLGAGLGYALYSIFTRLILQRGYSVFTNVFYTFLVAMLAYLVLAILDGSIQQIVTIPLATGLALLVGLLTGTLAYLLYTTGMQGMETSRAAQLATIEPATAAILGSVLFHQTLSGGELLGIVLILGAVILMNI